jgi:hypothetical protein
VPALHEHFKQAMLVAPSDMKLPIGLLKKLVVNPDVRFEIAERGAISFKDNFSNSKVVNRPNDITTRTIESLGVAR